jgi:hypothetical protein
MSVTKYQSPLFKIQKSKDLIYTVAEAQSNNIVLFYIVYYHF